MKRQQRDAPCLRSNYILKSGVPTPLSVEISHRFSPCVRQRAATAWLISTGSPNIGQRAAPHSQRGSTRKVLFLIIFRCKNLAVLKSKLKVIDNSTCIVGIYDSAETADLYTSTVWGCCLILLRWYAKTLHQDKTKNRFPTPFLYPNV